MPAKLIVEFTWVPSESKDVTKQVVQFFTYVSDRPVLQASKDLPPTTDSIDSTDLVPNLVLREGQTVKLEVKAVDISGLESDPLVIEHEITAEKPMAPTAGESSHSYVVVEEPAAA